MRTSYSPIFSALDPNQPNSYLLTLPPTQERAIAARWAQWIPWVCRDLRLRGRDGGISSPEFMRVRQRHSEHVLDLMRAGISMRTIRRHRLDDPRITDEVRAALVASAREQQSKARFQRKQDNLATLIRLASIVTNVATIARTNDSPEEISQAARVFLDPTASTK